MSADEASRVAVQREWGRRIQAEYRSAALVHHLTLWLIQVAAPPDLLEGGLRIARDELDHAQLSFDVFRAAGGDAPPALDRASLALPPARSLEWGLLEHGLRLLCIGETVAVRLFGRMREGAQQTTAKVTLDRILRDEVFHRDFGWMLLEWLLDGPEREARAAHVQRALPSLLAAVRESYGGGEVDGAHAASGVTAEQRSWGLISRQEYAAAVEETFTRDYGPRFSALGFSLSP